MSGKSVLLLFTFHMVGNTICLMSSSLPTNEKFGQLKCRIRSGVELLVKVGDSKDDASSKGIWSSVVLQVESHRTRQKRNISNLYYISNEKAIFTGLFNVYNKKRLFDKYRLKAINQSNNEVIWTYRGWYKPKKYLVNCFKEFTVKNIKLSLSEQNEWQLVWDELYWLAVLSPTYNIYVNRRLIDANIGNEACLKGTCKVQLNVGALKNCDENEFCIDLRFNLNKQKRKTIITNDGEHTIEKRTCKVLKQLCTKQR